MLNFAINNETAERANSLPFLTLTPSDKEMSVMAKSKVANSARFCQVDGCERKHHAKNYCGTHYAQILVHGRILNHTRHNEIEIKGNDCLVQLYNAKGDNSAVTVVDADDFELIKKHKWCLAHDRYVCTTVNKKKTYLSRYLMNPADGVEIDHKDRDPLNNRRSNLRIATSSQNSANTDRKNASGFRGVHWNENNLNWRSRIQHEGDIYEIGSFSNKEDAALAYNEKAYELFGEFAILNDVHR